MHFRHVSGNQSLFGAALAFILSPALSFQVQANPPKERSFRPIVPIKQDVRPGAGGMLSQTVKLTIPPPPIPEPTNSLFPAESVPDVTLPPEPPTFNDADSEPTDFIGPSTEVPEGLPQPEYSPPSPTDEEKPSGPTLSRLREEAHKLASRGLRYKFGADDPDTGGLDCSSTVQYLLEKIGVDGCPRTSYDQYYWLKKKKLLDDVYGKSADKKLFKKLSPGDLIFWGGTWKSGHRVSHVMIYMGYNPDEDKHYVFGARSKSSEGLLGNGVDVFELDPNRGRLIAHGKIPGLVYD